MRIKSGLPTLIDGYYQSAFDKHHLISMFLKRPRRLDECVLLIEFINAYNEFAKFENEKGMQKMWRYIQDGKMMGASNADQMDIVNKIREFKKKSDDDDSKCFEEFFKYPIEIKNEYAENGGVKVSITIPAIVADLKTDYYLINCVLIGTIYDLKKKNADLNNINGNIDSLLKYIDNYNNAINDEHFALISKMIKDIKDDIANKDVDEILRFVKKEMESMYSAYFEENNKLLKVVGYEDYESIACHLIYETFSNVLDQFGKHDKMLDEHKCDPHIDKYQKKLKDIKNDITNENFDEQLNLAKGAMDEYVGSLNSKPRNLGIGARNTFMERYLRNALAAKGDGNYHAPVFGGHHYIYNIMPFQNKDIRNRYFMNEGLKNIIILIDNLIAFKPDYILKHKEGEKLTIIIDDPLSSTDDIRTDTISNYIAKFLVKHDEYIDKVIILTHRLEIVKLFHEKIKYHNKKKYPNEYGNKKKCPCEHDNKEKYPDEHGNNKKCTDNIAIKVMQKDKKQSENEKYPVIRLSDAYNIESFTDEYTYMFKHLLEIVSDGESPLNSDRTIDAVYCRKLLEKFFGWYAGIQSNGFSNEIYNFIIK